MRFGKIRQRRSAGPDFKTKKQSVNGMIASGIWCVALALLIVAVRIASNESGTDIAPVGMLGMTSMLLSVNGVVIAGCGMKEREVNYILPIIGGVLNSGLFVYLLWLLLSGFVR